jgi:hypothetical protein
MAEVTVAAFPFAKTRLNPAPDALPPEVARKLPAAPIGAEFETRMVNTFGEDRLVRYLLVWVLGARRALAFRQSRDGWRPAR